MLKSIELKNSIDFEDIELKFSSGINIFIGEREALSKFSLEGMRCLKDDRQKVSDLYWDMPENNIYPDMIKNTIRTLIELQRQGVQIFITTYSYLVVKEFDLQIKENDNVMYNTLYKVNDKIKVMSTDKYSGLHPNPINDIFGDMVDREISRSINIGLDKTKNEP